MMRPMTSSGREFRSVGVIGLGTMGAGIAEVFARNGYQVVGVELTEETLERGRQHVRHSTDRAVKRGKLSEDEQNQIFDRITFTTELKDVADCQMVVEAIIEQLPLKQELFRTLDAIADRRDFAADRLAHRDDGIDGDGLGLGEMGDDPLERARQGAQFMRPPKYRRGAPDQRERQRQDQKNGAKGRRTFDC